MQLKSIETLHQFLQLACWAIKHKKPKNAVNIKHGTISTSSFCTKELVTVQWYSTLTVGKELYRFVQMNQEPKM